VPWLVLMEEETCSVRGGCRVYSVDTVGRRPRGMSAGVERGDLEGDGDLLSGDVWGLVRRYRYHYCLCLCLGLSLWGRIERILVTLSLEQPLRLLITEGA
jgi:hypothetical protein